MRLIFRSYDLVRSFPYSFMLRRRHARVEVSVLSGDHQYDMVYFTYCISIYEWSFKRNDGRRLQNRCWRILFLHPSICPFYGNFTSFWDLRSFRAQSWIPKPRTIPPPAQAVPERLISPESTAANTLNASMQSTSIIARRACCKDSGVFAIHIRPARTASRPPYSRYGRILSGLLGHSKRARVGLVASTIATPAKMRVPVRHRMAKLLILVAVCGVTGT